jgi:hypothetical protein
MNILIGALIFHRSAGTSAKLIIEEIDFISQLLRLKAIPDVILADRYADNEKF